MRDLTTLLSFQYTALFSIINPVGSAFIIFAITPALSESQRAQLARRIASFSWVMLVASYICGTHVLNFFGVSLPVLRVAGGLIVALAAWNMLITTEDPTQAGVNHANAKRGKPDNAFFPLTLPLTVGPGTISVAITLAADAHGTGVGLPYVWAAALAAITLITLTIYACYRYAGKLIHFLGQTGSDIIARLSGFLLFCIGIQIIWLGARELLLSLIQS